MSLPPKLANEIEELPSDLSPEVVEEDSVVNLVFRAFPVGPGYNSDSTDLLIRIPRSYPDAGPDMFWTTQGLQLVDGRDPEAANSLEIYMGNQWRRFSWHHNGWNPTKNNLHSYLEFVRRRLREAR